MKTFKLILVLALVFFAGVVIGVVGTRAVVRRAVQQALLHPEKIQADIERRMTRQLRLDNSQQAKLHDILSGSHAQFDDLRGKYVPQVVSILNQANGQITAMLTPEQQARFEEMKRKNHPIMRAIQTNQNP
jgi:Spy/CpxP family protein refolding chaperone